MVKQLAVSLSLTSLKLAAVLGDDIFPQIDRYLTFPLMETGQKLETLQPVLISANAYLGAQGIVQALQGGADVVNAIPGWSRTGFRDEAEHQFCDEAEQFQADPGKVFGFAGMISTGS